MISETITPEGELSAELERIERLAWHLDAGFRVPGTNIRFGWDSIIGLLPGAGDGAMALIGLYFPIKALQLGVGIGVVLRMLLNIAVDWLIGSIPLVGDIFDIGFRCNQRNAALIREALEHH